MCIYPNKMVIQLKTIRKRIYLLGKVLYETQENGVGVKCDSAKYDQRLSHKPKHKNLTINIISAG